MVGAELARPFEVDEAVESGLYPVFVFGSCDSFSSSALMAIHRLSHLDMELYISKFLILNAS